MISTFLIQKKVTWVIQIILIHDIALK